MAKIEVEVRSFISEEQYDELLVWFFEHGELTKKDYQETYYYDCPADLRIQRNSFESKVWLKKGKLHDEAREEIEIKADREKFPELEQLFDELGYGVDIKWFRHRHKFDWEGVKVCLDHTKGYGYILELEIRCLENEKDAVLAKLKRKMSELGIEITPKVEFDQAYENYKTNWEKLTK